MDRVVLGAGPVGLVAAYVLDADLCVDPSPGGRSALRRYAPTFLWRTEATEQLLLDLGLHFEPRTVRFGYLSDNGPKEDFTPEERIEYFRRSRGIPAGAPVEVPASAMSSAAGGEVETFDVSVDDLVTALLDRVEVLERRVVAVEVEEVAEGRKVPWVHVSLSASHLDFVGAELRTRELLNTLPAPVFDRLVTYRGTTNRPTPRVWESGMKTFVRVPIDIRGGVFTRARDELGFSYMYVVSGDRMTFPFDRVNFVDDAAILEFNGEPPRSGPVPWDVVAQGQFQVLGAVRDPVEYAGAVRHVGRLARWRHDVRIHSVVEELYE